LLLLFFLFFFGFFRGRGGWGFVVCTMDLSNKNNPLGAP
jgi:hypothetical protein